jgi:hypothetical protein
MGTGRLETLFGQDYRNTEVVKSVLFGQIYHLIIKIKHLRKCLICQCHFTMWNIIFIWRQYYHTKKYDLIDLKRLLKQSDEES